MDDEVLRLVQEIYYREDSAYAVLHAIGCPREKIPVFRDAASFWPSVLPDLDRLVPGGTIWLVKKTADTYRADGRAPRILARLSEERLNEDGKAAREVRAGPGLDVSAGLAQGIGPGNLVRPPDPLPGPRQLAGNNPSPPPIRSDEKAGAGTASCPTLTLYGTVILGDFLDFTTGLLGPHVRALYSNGKESALRIPDPGDREEWVCREVQRGMRERDTDCWVTYRKYPFEPYLYRLLKVYGPDATGYEMEEVPATCTPMDIADAYFDKRGALLHGREALVRAVMNLDLSPGTPRRLSLHTTLHECGVSEAAVLRIGAKAIAGNLHPELRIQEQLRAVAEIRSFAATHSRWFKVAACDNQQLPGRVTVEITRQGLAPPAAGEVADGAPAPRIISRHRVSIHLGSMFPLVAPQIVWDEPVFHPNIRWPASNGFPAGMLLLFHPLLTEYQPGQDLTRILSLIGDIASYREYDISEGDHSANPIAAHWAGTEAGQELIRQIGGLDLEDPLLDGARGLCRPSLLWLKPLGPTEMVPDGT